MNKRYLIALAIAIGVVLIDQLTKGLAQLAYQGGSRQIIVSFIDLVAIDNRGVAFGQGQNLGPIIFILIAFIIISLTGYFILHPNQPLLAPAIGLMIGGAIGNLIDRLDRGAVYDFISIGPWPAFNLADSAIVIGAGLLFYSMVAKSGDRDNPQE